MLRWLLRRQLDAEEKKVGESLDYLRHVTDVAPSALLRLASVTPFANSRKVLPKEAWFAGQLVAVQHEDCGTCLQITVNLARRSGVGADVVRAILSRDEAKLGAELSEVVQFTRGVLTASGEEDAVRESIRARYGDRGLIELSYAIAASAIPPRIKRALGYAKSCSLVPVQV